MSPKKVRPAPPALCNRRSKRILNIRNQIPPPGSSCKRTMAKFLPGHMFAPPAVYYRYHLLQCACRVNSGNILCAKNLLNCHTYVRVAGREQRGRFELALAVAVRGAERERIRNGNEIQPVGFDRQTGCMQGRKEKGIRTDPPKCRETVASPSPRY